MGGVYDEKPIAMCNPKVLPCDEKDKNTLTMFKHGAIDPSEILFYGPLEEKIVANGEQYIVTTLLAKSRGSGGNSSNNLHHLDLLDNGNLKADHMLHWIFNLSFLQYLDLTGIKLQEETNWLQLSYIWSITDFGTFIHPCNTPILLHLTYQTGFSISVLVYQLFSFQKINCNANFLKHFYTFKALIPYFWMIMISMDPFQIGWVNLRN
ncbi:hypothetical protein HN51_054063 [Arachis hypogaea]